MQSSTTPRLLAKWAERRPTTPMSSSRISAASRSSSVSDSPCRSAGDWIRGRIGVLVVIAQRSLSSSSRASARSRSPAVAQRLQCRHGLLGDLAGPAAAAVEPEEAG